MERGFTIQTSYGELAISAEDAGRLVALPPKILTRKVEGAPVRPLHLGAEALKSCA